MQSLFGRHIRPLAAALLLVATAQCVFAGKEFLAGAKEQTVSGQLVVGFEPGADVVQILAALAPQAAARLVSGPRHTYVLNVPPALQAAVSHLLAAHPMVKYVEPNRIRHTTVLPPNDTNLYQQWNLTAVQALQAWSYFPDYYLTAATAGTNRVSVAILDTGVDCTHPDFMNAGGTSTNSANGGQLLWASSEALAATTISSPACPWQDDNGHGTHTAGILAAATNNATGVSSLGYPLQLIVIKTNNASGEATDVTVAQGIDAAVNAGAQVISMSLGGDGYSQNLQSAMDYAWQHNVLVVAAAGNDGNSDLEYPGGGNHVLGVAATTSTNAVAGFSTYGNWVKIAAPGVNVYSTLPTYGSGDGANYGFLSGTSMATPHVAALGGLLVAANPGISVAALAQRIQQTAQSPNSGWNEFIGYGVINAGAALGGIVGPFTQGSLTGQIVDNNGNPLTGAVVTAGSQSYTTINDPNTGDTDGLFRIPNLNPGAYAISVTASGFSTVNIQGTVVAGADTMLTIQMGVSYGEFTGTVTHNGVAVPGAIVEAVSGGLIQGTAVSNSSGTYALYIQPGTYTLTASAPNYINATSASEPLTANGAVTVNLSLSALGTISGTVSDVNGLPIANAHIDFTNSSFTGGAVTGANGSYVTYGIAAGTYTVTASASGFANVSVSSVSVTNNVSTVVNLKFSTGIALSSGLLAYWPLNDDTGTVAHDQSGNGYNATLQNTTWVPGLFNYAVNFNGGAGSTPAIPFTNTFSISSWVQAAVTTQSAWAGIAESESTNGAYWMSLGVDSTGTQYKFIVNNATASTGTCGDAYGCAQGGTVSSGWHMVTGTYDGTTALLYVDAVLVASDTALAPANATVALQMGSSWTTSESWNGALDGMRLYNRALTAEEVSSIFTQATTLSLTKTAGAATVAAGSPIGYTLAVKNTGSGTATVATLSDPLPAGTGIGWSISPAYSGPGTCSIASGTLTCNFGSLSAGVTATVQVASATSTSSCATYANTASASASNAITVQGSATTTVSCGQVQTITFGPLSNQTLGTAPFTVSATASSGLTVSFNSQTGSVCTVSGSTVTLVTTGTCTVQATQAGNGTYGPANPVNQSFQVTQGTLQSQTITFGALSNKVFGSGTFTVSATATSGLAVSFNSQTPAMCTMGGSTVTLAGVGTCTIQATQAGNSTYAAATPVNQSFQITQGSQTISFGTLANKALGVSPFTVSATATSGLTVSFNSQTTSICTVSGAIVTLVKAGTCTIQATQTGNTNWAAASPVNQSFTVTGPSVTFGASYLSFAATVVGKSSAVQTVTLQNSGNSALTISSIQITNADAADYQYTADANQPCPISPSTLAAGATCTLDVAFTPKSSGSQNNAQITVTDNAGNVAGSTQEVGLTGTGIVLSSIAISAANTTIPYNTTEQFTATGTYSDSSTANISTQVTWASSVTNTATINASGLLSAVNPGQSNITASLSGITSNIFQLTVTSQTPASIVVSSGSGQSTALAQPFANSLQALVKDISGNVVPNITVTFTAPASGASGTFANGQATSTATTNGSGIATATTFSANTTTGNYAVSASVSGVSTPASFFLTNIKAPTLTITAAPVGTFVQGNGAAYTITVGNAATGSTTSGPVTVTEVVPAGLTLIGMSGGSTWSCSGNTCTTNSTLAAGSSYPAITVTVGVGYNTAASVNNQATVTGGGSAAATAMTPTTIISACNITLSGNLSIADAQKMINEALGVSPATNDLNGDGKVNVVDLQLVVTAVLGMGCSAT